MGYKKSLSDAVRCTLASRMAIGESRADAKADGSADAKIFSYSTRESYEKACIRFTDYCKENFGCKNLTQCREHVNSYIQAKRDEGVSAYTQKSYLSAIGKLYGQSFFKDVETDVRHRADITRSRLDTESQRHFSETRNADLKEFCQATGLRRHELENLKGGTCYEKDGQYYVHVDNGKGGKSREVKILGNNQNVIDKIQNTADGEKVWGKIHSKAPVHEYRADYANALYNNIARDVSTLSRSERYDCRSDMAGRSFDKQAMREVSNNLGHNRIDVIAQNYLR